MYRAYQAKLPCHFFVNYSLKKKIFFKCWPHLLAGVIVKETWKDTVGIFWFVCLHAKQMWRNIALVLLEVTTERQGTASQSQTPPSAQPETSRLRCREGHPENREITHPPASLSPSPVSNTKTDNCPELRMYVLCYVMPFRKGCERVAPFHLPLQARPEP